MKRPSRWLFAILFFTAVTAVLATLALVAAGPALAAEAAPVAVDPSGAGPSQPMQRGAASVH